MIPSKRNRKVEIPYDRERHRTRHRGENLLCRMKDFTRIALRKDKTSRSHAGFASLALAIINSQLCPQSLVDLFQRLIAATALLDDMIRAVRTTGSRSSLVSAR